MAVRGKQSGPSGNGMLTWNFHRAQLPATPWGYAAPSDRRLQEPVLRREQRRPRTAIDSDLGVHVGDVVLHRLR
jgi:hypothetical protein